MKARASALFSCLGLLMLAACASGSPVPAQPPPVPPPSAEEDRTAYNHGQVALFVSQDPGWQAWLNAMRWSSGANSLLVGVSRYNTPVSQIIQAVTAAQDAYRIATSFRLPAFTVTSSCLAISSETTGTAQLQDGLRVRYAFLLRARKTFENGSSCEIDTGLINEVDSSGGLPIAKVVPGQTIDWQESFSRYLVWSQPFWELSTGTTLSRSDLLGLIER